MLIFIGDVHGEFNELISRLANHNICNSTFIQVGDFGVGFKSKETETRELNRINDRLKADRCTMYVIRGNHDDPSYFSGEGLYSNLIFLNDYSLLQVEGKKILLIGGAISIDRRIRELNVNYWEEEGFVYNEQRLRSVLSGVDNLDIVATHSCPHEFEPAEFNQLVVSYWMKDNGLITELKKERGAHSLLMHALTGLRLKPTHWYYGHFHSSFQSNYKGLRYRMLNCSEFFEHR